MTEGYPCTAYDIAVSVGQHRYLNDSADPTPVGDGITSWWVDTMIDDDYDAGALVRIWTHSVETGLLMVCSSSRFKQQYLTEWLHDHKVIKMTKVDVRSRFLVWYSQITAPEADLMRGITEASWN